MSFGKAKGLTVKIFEDYSDGTVEEKINKFFSENKDVEILDIKYQINYIDLETYGCEKAMVIYREN